MPKRNRVRPISPPTIKGDDEMRQDLSKYVTTRQAAELLGVNRFWIVRLLANEKIKGHKLGHDWIVFAPSLEKYRETKSKRGRPSTKEKQLREESDGQG
jgi:excisionase family DNA binding protein